MTPQLIDEKGSCVPGVPVLCILFPVPCTGTTTTPFSSRLLGEAVNPQRSRAQVCLHRPPRPDPPVMVRLVLFGLQGSGLHGCPGKHVAPIKIHCACAQVLPKVQVRVEG